MTVVTFCCAVLINFYRICLLSVRGHAHCCLISQLKWSASKPHVCFICYQNITALCSCLFREKEKREKNKHASLRLAYVNVAITCITLMHCRVSGVSTNVIWQTGNVMKRTICRQNNKRLSIIAELVNVSYFHLFLGVAVKLKRIRTSVELALQPVALLCYRRV